MSGHAAAVIVAAGRGDRFGASDKVLAPLAGQPVLAYALTAASAVSAVSEIILVIAPHVEAAIEDLVATGIWPKVRVIVPGGPRRQDSVAAGVHAVSPGLDLVAIHDAVRPLAPASLFAACLRAAAESGAAIAAVPVTNTLKRVHEQRIIETVPRHELWAAQTPQAFRCALLEQALAAPLATEQTYTDEAALFEALGLPVTIVPGSSLNLKITHPDDLAIAAALLQARLATIEGAAP